MHISSQPAEKTTGRTAGTQFPDVRPTPNPNHMSHLGDSVLNYDFYLAWNMTMEHEDYFICECKLPTCYVFGLPQHTKWVQELMSFKKRVSCIFVLKNIHFAAKKLKWLLPDDLPGQWTWIITCLVLQSGIFLAFSPRGTPRRRPSRRALP